MGVHIIKKNFLLDSDSTRRDEYAYIDHFFRCKGDSKTKVGLWRWEFDLIWTDIWSKMPISDTITLVFAQLLLIIFTSQINAVV